MRSSPHRPFGRAPPFETVRAESRATTAQTRAVYVMVVTGAHQWILSGCAVGRSFIVVVGLDEFAVPGFDALVCGESGDHR